MLMCSDPHRWLTAVALWLLSLGAWAQEAAAELRSATGTVYAQSSSGQVRLVQKGANLNVGDMVVTEKAAFALIVFADGTRTALRPETAFKIHAFNYKADDAKGDQMSVELVKGWLRNVSGQVGKRSTDAAYQMRVSTSSVGIRGTDFAVRLCDQACANQAAENPEGVLPQSGRLGQIYATDKPVLLSRAASLPRTVSVGEALLLGDTVSTADASALLGLDDGTRLILGPMSSVALRAEEDDRGRRVVRADLLQGQLRLATVATKGARLYGLLVQAGGNLGVRPGSALDLQCGASADEFAYACPQAQGLLRNGQVDRLLPNGVKPLVRGTVQDLGESPAERKLSGWALPHLWQVKTLVGAQAVEPWTPTWTDFESPQRRASAWRLAQAETNNSAGRGINTSNLPDPMDIPAESVQPPTSKEPAVAGTYTAVFDGLVSVSNAGGQVLVSAGQAAFTTPDGRTPPRVLPSAPAFMERDKELQKSKLNPNQCLK